MKHPTMGHLRLTTMLALVLPLAAVEVPFGHADWKPSPTDPVGFAGQGNNWFPGATPPSEWSATAGGPAKNLRWTVPIPGWTDAQPLAVNGRIIGVYSPHHVVCYDAQTGKVLWQDELRLMTLPVLGGDRKSPGPAPAATKAAKLQVLWEQGLSQTRIHLATGLAYNDYIKGMLGGIATERRDLIQHVVEVLGSWRADLGQQWPEAVAALDKDLEFYRQALDPTAHEALLERTANLRRGQNNFAGWVAQTTGVRLVNNWQGSVSDVMASPVSDGEVVAVTLGFGQIAVYDLATGKRRWAFRDPLMIPGAVCHNASPLLWKGRLLMNSPGEKRDRHWWRSIRAYDLRTGALAWETFEPKATSSKAWGDSAWHGFHTAPYLLRHQDRAFVISPHGHVVDAETGRSIANLPANPTINKSGWGAGFISSDGERVFKADAVDTGGQMTEIFPITWQEGVPSFGTSVEGSFKPSQGSFAVSDRLCVVPTGGMFEIASGKVLGSFPRGGISATIAGDLVYVCYGSERSNLANKDGGDAISLRTQVYGAGRAIENVLQIAGYTPDISYRYFPRFATDKTLRKWGALSYGHCNYQGIGFNVAVDTAGLTAYGSRLYLHAPAHLVCLGER